MNEQLQELRAQAVADLGAAATTADLADWYGRYLGRKGEVTQTLRLLGDMPAAARPGFGQAVNALKAALQTDFERRQDAIRAGEVGERLRQEAVDVTLPGREPDVGTLHPVTQMIREVTDIFAHLGFQTVEGPEIEDAYYAFDALNIPKEHPARDVWDTIFIRSASREIVLRPHTSPMQIRTMERTEPPVRVVVPGRCYRYEALDATHEWHFHQIEGLAVDEHITMADLKGTLAEFARQVFGRERKVRFRCDYFPFVEPGVDFAIDCMVCKGTGCRICKGTGWIEILGAGMVHPNLLINVGYDPERYTGWAFGMGIERLVMLKYGVQDIRAFYQGDLRFLEQFNRTI
ncbi:MAG TPA: phenylalanine--tRNA ligase subunit alpha [Thermomicrobiaceae bacterium]|nr:phenylalanine--tRNA ligase subunit alpha [Thermomicrobiaceae bacterium]